MSCDELKSPNTKPPHGHQQGDGGERLRGSALPSSPALPRGRGLRAARGLGTELPPPRDLSGS